MTDTFSRGDVVWHTALFRDSGRPWVVLSDESHPFHGTEYLVAGVTTTERDEAVPIPERRWVTGAPPRTSYVSPWFVSTIKHDSVESGVGSLDSELVDRLLSEVRSYLGVRDEIGYGSTTAKGQPSVSTNESKQIVKSQFVTQFEQTIRDVLAGISQAELNIMKEIPEPNRESTEINLPPIPELQTLSVRSFENMNELDISLYFSPLPEGKIPVVPDEVYPEVEFKKPHDREEPTYLRELGGKYERLSETLTDILNRYCDAPEEQPGQIYVGGQPDFLCTHALDADLISFGTYIGYPSYVDTVYRTGDRELAEEYGLPL